MVKVDLILPSGKRIKVMMKYKHMILAEAIVGEAAKLQVLPFWTRAKLLFFPKKKGGKKNGKLGQKEVEIKRGS